jgi:hypothetical protein
MLNQNCLADVFPMPHSCLGDAFLPGTTEVWYKKERAGAIDPPLPEAGFLEKTHVLLGSIAQPEGTSLDDLWSSLQGENWSPNGEANHLIRSKGLRHTSMSVGDCFRLPNGAVWMVDSFGFKQVH